MSSATRSVRRRCPSQPPWPTIIACQFSSEQVRGWLAQEDPSLAELAAMRDVEYVELPTGHWPQFTRPVDLGQAILAAVDR